MEPEEAREELRRVAGTQLDPRCVAAFLTATEVTDTAPPPLPEEPRPPQRGLLGDRRRAREQAPEKAPVERG
jgi:hypothetical protein